MKLNDCRLIFPVLLVIILFVFPACTEDEVVRNYKIRYGTFTNSLHNLIVLREFKSGSGTRFLSVDPKTLKTYIVKSTEGTFNEFSWSQLKDKYAETPYIKAIVNAAANSSKLQDAGITHALPSERGINLTIDLCPSKKNLDRRIFTSIINEFNRVEKPTPIALSVSGLWINDHQNDLNWIKELIQEGKISVEWINHSYSHRFNKNLPLKENFLLEKGTKMDYEILTNEITMIKNGLVPSVFFRFPGLVSDESVFEKVTAFGLIPIGTDAWLAKGENAKKGSVVLIHGNGNEPIGVNDFLNLIRTEKDNVKNKNWLLFDLNESMSEEEK